VVCLKDEEPGDRPALLASALSEAWWPKTHDSGQHSGLVHIKNIL